MATKNVSAATVGRPTARMGTCRQLLAACMLSTMALATAHAQTYPNRPIRWIVPWPAGGGGDLLARILNVKLGEILGQPVIIDNRGGAAGNIGAGAGAKAPADGYTITFAYSGTHSINPHVYSKMTFKESDFAPVIFLTLVPQVLVVNSKLGVHNLNELLALAKTRKITYASSAMGSIGHLGGELLALMTGANMMHVPYRGGGPAMSALLSGEIDALIAVPVVIAPQIQAGKLRAIATTTAQRAQALAQVPTIAESGVAGFDTSSWNGVLVPAGTPPEVIAKLNTAFNAVMADPRVKQQLIDAGYEIVGGEPDKFSRFISSELAKWKPVVQKINLQVN